MFCKPGEPELTGKTVPVVGRLILEEVWSSLFFVVASGGEKMANVMKVRAAGCIIMPSLRRVVVASDISYFKARKP